jgi:asparagine synthase (glutamine-hydrolysing)
MCGIGGCVVPAGGTPDRAALERMARSMAHRGPDDRGIEVIGTVGLVHTRLSIVDPSPAGHQPMRHPDGGWWVTYNGETFNHLELRRELPATSWRGGSDTETLLHALAAWGEDAVARCNGLYAYAALDTARRRLLLVRDRFGVKPLYWARHAGALWFASEIGALLAAGVPRAPEPGLARHAVAFGWVNGPRTPIAAVHRLLPGTLMTVDLDTGETAEREWYAPAEVVDPERAVALASRHRDGLRDEVEATLRASVRRRLMADVPVGTMCSGGLDSSLIAAFARDEHHDIQAFNASVADQPERDEGPWAQRVASALGIALHTVHMDAASWRTDLVETVRHTEYPLTHESSVPMSQIAGLARTRGVKVLLSGEGADELFGGYDWTQADEYAAFRDPPGRRALRWLRRRARLRQPADPRGEPDAEAAAFETALDVRALAAYRHHRGARRRLEAGCLANLGTYLPHLLNRQDKTTMQRSIETRVPFLDPEVAALAVNLPLEARVLPQRKAILRELADRHLPEGIADRPKVGFGFDVAGYLVDAARPEFLADGALRELFAVEPDTWQEATGALEGHAALLFWTGEIWARALLEGHDDESIAAALWRDGPEGPVAAGRAQPEASSSR